MVHCILWASEAKDFSSYYFRNDCTNSVFIVDKLEQEEDDGFLDVITIFRMDFVCHVFEFLYCYKE